MHHLFNNFQVIALTNSKSNYEIIDVNLTQTNSKTVLNNQYRLSSMFFNLKKSFEYNTNHDLMLSIIKDVHINIFFRFMNPRLTYMYSQLLSLVCEYFEIMFKCNREILLFKILFYYSLKLQKECFHKKCNVKLKVEIKKKDVRCKD